MTNRQKIAISIGRLGTALIMMWMGYTNTGSLAGQVLSLGLILFLVEIWVIVAVYFKK